MSNYCKKTLCNRCVCYKNKSKVVGLIGPSGPQGPKGNTGATGPTGPSTQIIVRSTTSVQPNMPASVESYEMENSTYLDFYIPRGQTGASEIVKAGTTIVADPDEEANVLDRYVEGVHYLDFIIPKGATGDKGDKGDSGKTDVQGAYIISYNDDPNNFPAEGKEILPNERLPLMRLELDYGNIIVLDSNDNTIQFNKTGVYSISFTASAYVKKSGQTFDPTVDFVSLAFREAGAGRENIIAAATAWTPNECASTLFGQSIFVVGDVATAYELVNTQQRSIYINGCNIQKTISHSYFSVPMVTIVIKKMS